MSSCCSPTHADRAGYEARLTPSNGQVDLAETDENEKGNGRQERYKCGIGPRPCKLMIMRDSVVHPETYHRLKTGCSFELYNILGQHTEKLPVWSMAGPFWSLYLATGS